MSAPLLIRVTKVAKETGLTADLLRDMASRGVLPARVDTGGRDDYFYVSEIWPAIQALPRLDRVTTAIDITKTAAELATASSGRPTRTQQRRRNRGSSAQSAPGACGQGTTEGPGAERV